jgi:hypothetical protein
MSNGLRPSHHNSRGIRGPETKHCVFKPGLRGYADHPGFITTKTGVAAIVVDMLSGEQLPRIR